MTNVRITIFQRQALLVGVDTLLVLIGIIAALWLAQQYPITRSAMAEVEMNSLTVQWYWVVVLLGSWYLFGWLNDAYNVLSFSDSGQYALRIVIVGIMATFAGLLITMLLPVPLPDAFALYFLSIGLPLVVVWRHGYALLSKTPAFRYRTVILGEGKRAQVVMDMLRGRPGTDYQVLGYVRKASGKSLIERNSLPATGVSTELADLIRRLRIDDIVVAVDEEVEPNLFEDLVTCQANGVRVSMMPTMYSRMFRRVPLEYVDPSWVLDAVQSASSSKQRIFKRLLDLSICLLALPWLLLVFPALAVAIKLNSQGPVFYKQIRSGLGGKPFWILKFRTMVNDAEKDGKAVWAEEDDPRITRVGHILRKLRLDELPQIFNVLRGEMSLIGPRPERPEFIEQLEMSIPYYRTRLLVKPGLTGWAQVHHSYTNSVDGALTKLQYDVYYVRHWSLWLDMYTLFQTISVVLSGKGT